jgi:hypothetical protein
MTPADALDPKAVSTQNLRRTLMAREAFERRRVAKFEIVSTYSMSNASSNKSGCLGLLLQMLGVTPSTSTATTFPFRLRDDFLSPAEISFYHVLRSTAGDKFTVCPKVNLSDIFFVSRPDQNQAARNRISRKHGNQNNKLTVVDHNIILGRHRKDLIRLCSEPRSVLMPNFGLVSSSSLQPRAL